MIDWLEGAAIGADLLGDFYSGRQNRKAIDRANAQNYRIWQKGFEEQQYLARNQIQVRTADALKAGIHPLYALGQPAIGGNPVSMDFQPSTGSGAGDALKSLGRNVSRLAEQRAQREHELDMQYKQAAIDKTNAETMNQRQRTFVDGIIQASNLRRMMDRSNYVQDSPPNEVVRETRSGALVPSNVVWDYGPQAPQQDVEDRYGGIIGESYGIWSWLQDAINHDNARRGSGSSPADRPASFLYRR